MLHPSSSSSSSPSSFAPRFRASVRASLATACGLAAAALLGGCAASAPHTVPVSVAAAEATRLPSAHDVKPEVVEADPETADDRALAARVSEALAKDDALDPQAKEAVSVRCRRGRVLLRGGMASRDDKARVEASARAVAGGANVVSDLALVGAGLPTSAGTGSGGGTGVVTTAAQP